MEKRAEASVKALESLAARPFFLFSMFSVFSRKWMVTTLGTINRHVNIIYYIYIYIILSFRFFLSQIFLLKTENGENIENLFVGLFFLLIFVTLLGVLNLPGLG